MPHAFERFLRHRTGIAKTASLGRVFGVTRETWRLTDDPRQVAPTPEVVVSRRTAADAADLARDAASTFGRHGFHKPSGSWWAADDEHFHRFVVHPGRRRAKAALLVATGLAGLIAVALIRRGRVR